MGSQGGSLGIPGGSPLGIPGGPLGRLALGHGPMGPGPWADGPFGPIGPLDRGPWARAMGPGTRNEYIHVVELPKSRNRLIASCTPTFRDTGFSHLGYALILIQTREVRTSTTGKLLVTTTGDYRSTSYTHVDVYT